MSTSRSRSTTPTTLASGRRSRSTRAARASSQRSSTGSSRGRGGRDSESGRILANINQAPARKWALTLRPAAPGVNFSVPMWVPVEKLTPEERDEHLRRTEKTQGKQQEQQQEQRSAADQEENLATTTDATDTTSCNVQAVSATTSATATGEERQIESSEPLTKRIKVDHANPLQPGDDKTGQAQVTMSDMPQFDAGGSVPPASETLPPNTIAGQSETYTAAPTAEEEATNI